jgi:hypothetical protein
MSFTQRTIKNNQRKRGFSVVLMTATLLCLTPMLLEEAALAQTPRVGDRTMFIGVNSIRILDEDDPLSNDEPYLIVTKFVMKVRVMADGRTVTIVPGTLHLQNVMSGHHSLGHSEENWADEVNTYNLPAGIPRFVQAVVPWDEPGWVVGAVVTHMEKDGFSSSTANLLGREIQSAIERAFTTMSFSISDTRSLTDSLVRKVSADLSGALRRVSVGGIIRGIASAVDPDDFGGMNIILLATAPRNRVFMFAGAPPPSLAAALLSVREITSSAPVALNYPTAGLGTVPDKARFQGRHTVNCDVRIGRLAAP